jgi:PBSX family phage terminase large subunit
MTTPTQTIRLYPQQKQFLESSALYRAFAGGIGSGKSWILSYDAIRRGKPGRTYAVIGPTYTVLQDSTWKTFKRVAEDLRVIGDIRESAPPSIKLLTGSEFLFRSADDPDKLRGPNLSGIVLDEASLMPLAVYEIAIGRLREEGQQGWLSAGFTPKGRTHWSFEVFATGRPDTELITAKTRDNPFLPPSFHATLARQYTASLRSQELEGEFVEAGGLLFRRAWFGIVEQAPHMEMAIRGWDLASVHPDDRRHGGYDPDYTCGCLIGRTVDQTYYIMDVRRTRDTPAAVQTFVRQTAEEDGKWRVVCIEEDPGSAGKSISDHYRRHVLPGFIFYAVRSTGSKADRALPLAAMAEGGAVKIVRGSWNAAFLDEIESFPFGRKDDQIDAASLAFNRLAKQPHVVSQPPTILTPPRASAFDSGDLALQWNHGRHPTGGATGLDGSNSAVAQGEFIAPGSWEAALQWPKYWVPKQD